MTSSSSSSHSIHIELPQQEHSYHPSCKCEDCNRQRIVNKKTYNRLYKQRIRKSECENPRENCVCDFHVKYRSIKEKDKDRHSLLRSNLSPEQKAPSLTSNRQNKKNVRLLLTPEQKEANLISRASKLHEETLEQYTKSVQTVFSNQELKDLDDNLEFSKYAGNNAIFSDFIFRT